MNPMTRFTSLLLASLVLFASSCSAQQQQQQQQQQQEEVTGQRPPDCFGDEVTIDFSNSLPSTRRSAPLLLYTLERGATLPPGLVLDRRTGIVTGVLRDKGFQNVYNITVVGTDPTDSATPYDRLHRSSVVVTSTWCTGARISRFLLVPTTTTTTTTRTHNNNKVIPTRIIHSGDTIHLGCGVEGGFNLEVETFSEFSREAQSEGDLTGHVEFVLDERLVRTERAFPFALGGFDVNRGFLDFGISPGQHTLTAIPYNPSGHEGTSKTITFTIVGVQEGDDCCGATTTY